MKFECPQHKHKKTHAHIHKHNLTILYNKVIWEPWRSNIQICQREKNDNSIVSQSLGVLWLWLFIWSRTVQSASEQMQVSISFRIWEHLQASNHSSQSLFTTLFHLFHLNLFCPSFPQCSLSKILLFFSSCSSFLSQSTEEQGHFFKCLFLLWLVCWRLIFTFSICASLQNVSWYLNLSVLLTTYDLLLKQWTCCVAISSSSHGWTNCILRK